MSLKILKIPCLGGFLSHSVVWLAKDCQKGGFMLKRCVETKNAAPIWSFGMTGLGLFRVSVFTINGEEKYMEVYIRTHTYIYTHACIHI